MPSKPPELGRLAAVAPLDTSLFSGAYTPGSGITLRSTVPSASALIR